MNKRSYKFHCLTTICSENSREIYPPLVVWPLQEHRHIKPEFFHIIVIASIENHATGSRPACPALLLSFCHNQLEPDQREHDTQCLIQFIDHACPKDYIFMTEGKRLVSIEQRVLEFVAESFIFIHQSHSVLSMTIQNGHRNIIP